MKKVRSAIAVTLTIAVLVISSMSMVFAEETPQLDQGGWESPDISSVDMSIENKTGFFRFEFTATGSSPEGTDHVNVTFGGLNGTRIELAEGIWFSEGGFILFGNGISLEASGTDNETWSNWTFKIRIALPFDGDYDQLIETLLPMLPFETDDVPIEGLTSNLTDNVGNITKALSEMQIYLIARSYNETGAWGQEAFDITDHVLTALLQFLIDEGMLEAPNADDDDEEPFEPEDEEKDKGGARSILLLGIFIVGIVALLAVVAVSIYLAMSSKRKEQ